MLDSLNLPWSLITNTSFPVNYEGTLPDFGLLSPDSFPVIRFNDDLTAGPSESGWGLLIVTDVLTLTDGWSWDGVVLAGHFNPPNDGVRVDGLVVSGLNGLGGIAANTAAGVTLFDIRHVGTRMEFRALTRYPTVTLQSTGVGASGSVFTVDGVASAGSTVPFRSDPFQGHTLEAGGGALSGVGFRNGFGAWSDGQPRVRPWTTGLADSTLAASYGNAEVSFDITLESPVPGVVPGVVVLNPDAESGWIPEATDVSVWVQPRNGLAFRDGALAGRPNPTTVRLTASAAAAARFDLSYVVSSDVGLQVNLGAASDVDIRFRAVNGNQPLDWTANGLPQGMAFVGDSTGILQDSPLVMGDFVVTVQATDAIGLTDSVSVGLTIGPPIVGLQVMALPFLGFGVTNSALASFLDLQRDGDGTYDLGDFRAWVLGNPDHPSSAPARTPPRAGGLADPIVIPLFRKDQP